MAMGRFFVMVSFPALLVWAGCVSALDYGAVAGPSAIIYDGPALKSKKLYVVSRHTPFELVVTLNDWVKVRGQDGTMGWVEKRALGGARYVVVTAALADVRKSPDPAAMVAFQARKQVALEWVENTGTGWIKVRHADGAAGYIKALDVWGD